MQNKTQIMLIYALVIVALVLLYKVFNWDKYRCMVCGKFNGTKYGCAGCGSSEVIEEPVSEEAFRRLRRRRAVIPAKAVFSCGGTNYKSPSEPGYIACKRDIRRN
jgi:hypothetical protein